MILYDLRELIWNSVARKYGTARNKLRSSSPWFIYQLGLQFLKQFKWVHLVTALHAGFTCKLQCAQCGKEAIFYCCWNTSYCDYPCQQAHWPRHMHTCTQTTLQDNQQQPVMVSTNPVAIGNPQVRSHAGEPRTVFNSQRLRFNFIVDILCAL